MLVDTDANSAIEPIRKGIFDAVRHEFVGRWNKPANVMPVSGLDPGIVAGIHVCC
jgi:hypothetical protein